MLRSTFLRGIFIQPFYTNLVYFKLKCNVFWWFPKITSTFFHDLFTFCSDIQRLLYLPTYLPSLCLCKISSENIKISLKPFGFRLIFGGGEGSRTPVRKRIHRNLSERRRSFAFPYSAVGRHTAGLGRVIMRGTVNSFRAHGHHWDDALARLVVLPGRTAAFKPRRELRYRRSLIYNCPF